MSATKKAEAWDYRIRSPDILNNGDMAQLTDPHILFDLAPNDL